MKSLKALTLKLKSGRDCGQIMEGRVHPAEFEGPAIYPVSYDQWK